MGVDAGFGQGDDDHGERDLDGVTVLQLGEVELRELLGEDGFALRAVLQGHGMEDGEAGVATRVAAGMVALELDVVVAE